MLTLFAVVESLWTFALHLDPVLWGCSALSIPFIFLTAAIVGGLASANLAPDLDACGASAGVCGLLGAPTPHNAGGAVRAGGTPLLSLCACLPAHPRSLLPACSVMHRDLLQAHVKWRQLLHVKLDCLRW